MNKHLQSMKDTVTTYHAKAKAAEAAINKAIEQYKPNVAREQVATIREALQAAKLAALDAIRDAQMQGADEYAAKWDNLSGEDITPDAQLLQTGLMITQRRFDALCSKYRDAGNATMCKLLADYADANNKRLAKENPGEIFPDGYLTKNELPSPETNAKEWARAAKAAENLIERMTGTGWMQGANNSVTINAVEHFGENVDV